MKRIDSAQSWEMKIAGEDMIYPASVPGSVYSDLIHAGRLDDPYYRDNEDVALALMKNDFIYSGTFDADLSDVTDSDEVLLRFHGLDTIADILLNGCRIGSTDNMHRVWDYSVRDLLKDTGNELEITFHSPVRFIAEQYAADPAILGTEDAMRGFPKIRKGHYMFGWDWGPRLPDAGIWKEVELLHICKARFDSVYVSQKFSDDLKQVTLDIHAALRYAEGVSSVTCRPAAVVSIAAPDGAALSCRPDLIFDENGVGRASLVIDQPQLWWPNGLGQQPLYTIAVELFDDKGSLIDDWRRRIGIRKMEVSTAKDAYGSEFAHMVNGVKFFAMGADYIPEDNILARTNRERTFRLIRQCVDANFNCIRVWGGGLYPSDDFYDACDEMGLVVWQDFMFACANYRLTRAFEENILAELRDNVRRLRHHASLGLWCGNNEMEMFVKKGEWGAKNEIRSDYVKMYEYLFPRLLETEDPDRFYWPASPSSGGGFDEPNDENRGDVHYWDVWHGNKPFTEYRKFYFRYLSEFGFQSFPSLKTVESFTLPEDRNVFSYIMEKHQRNASANGKIMNYMEQTFLYPNDLDTLIYASQLLQGEAIRYGVEHFRRNRGRCMGAIYWQLNDCWPVASWASIDYFGRWKALHYYARRFFSPLLLSCEEEGVLSQTMNTNAEPFPVRKSIRLNVANESMYTRNVTVKWQLRDRDGSVIREGNRDLEVEPLTCVWLDKEELDDAKLYENYVSYQLYEDGREVSGGTVLFCAPKHFRFLDPQLQISADGNEITVRAAHYAKSVEIRNGNDDLILSDNFFDLNGGEKRVRVLKGNTEKLEVRSVYSIK